MRTRCTYVPPSLELTDEEIDRMEQYPFRAAFYIRRDPLPRAIVVRVSVDSHLKHR